MQGESAWPLPNAGLKAIKGDETKQLYSPTARGEYGAPDNERNDWPLNTSLRLWRVAGLAACAGEMADGGLS